MILTRLLGAQLWPLRVDALVPKSSRTTSMLAAFDGACFEANLWPGNLETVQSQPFPVITQAAG